MNMNTDYIEASFDTLTRQASDTVASYLRSAVQEIDSTFSDGYAEKHPELVAAFIQASVSGFNASATAKVLGASIGRVSEAIERLADKD